MMKNRWIHRLLIVLGVLAFLAPSARAQDAATAAPRDQVNTQSMMDALNNISGRIKDYNAVKGKTVSQFKVVDIRTLLQDADSTTYREALTYNQPHVDYLRDISGKVKLMDKVLTDNKIDHAQVIAVDVLANGDIILFYDGQAVAPTGAATGEQAAADPKPASGGR